MPSAGAQMSRPKEPLIFGWEEWVALPELGLPAIKAKIDTGARTSALHAFLIEPYGPPSGRRVRFGIHPVPGRDDIEVFGSADVVDRREVTSSNGEKESRIFIRTPLSMGDRTWMVEIGLTNREGMAYRMLLGRQAISRQEPAITNSSREPLLKLPVKWHGVRGVQPNIQGFHGRQPSDKAKDWQCPIQNWLSTSG